MSASCPAFLVLGAGAYQLPLILRARQMGYFVHVCSTPGAHPGVAAASRFHAIDSTDTEAVLALAREYDVAGIATSGTDVCVPTIGTVCDELGLAGPSRHAAEIMSRKDLFRQFQHREGLSMPAHVSASDAEAFRREACVLLFPLIVKPVDSSGSRGVTRVESKHGLLEAYHSARQFSRSGVVCAEEVLLGTEVGGNAIIQDQSIRSLVVTEKHLSGFIVVGHSLPSPLPADRIEAVRRELERAVRRLEYRDGLLNFDLMVGARHASIIELGARAGGNGITELMTRADRHDAHGDIVRAATRQPLAPPESHRVRPCGSVVVDVPRPGRLTHLPDLVAVQAACPTVFAVNWQRAVGDAVTPMRNNADQLGVVLFDIPANTNWLECREQLRAGLDLGVES